jgi:hypothetical protein
VLGIRTRLCLCHVLPLSLLSMPLAAQQAGEGQSHGLTYQLSGLAHRTSTTFELNGGKIYVPVQVNSKGPYWFILDTGSVSDVVDTDTAKNIGIAVSGGFEASGGGEKTIEGAVGAHVSLRIKGLELKQPAIDVEPINQAVSATEGREVDGLLGYDFLSRFVVMVDYINCRVDIIEPASFHYAGSGDTMPIEMIRGNIFVSSTLTMGDGKPVAGKFLVDTAWRSALSLTSPFQGSHGLLAKVPKSVDAVTGIGIGGSTVDTVARISSLKLGRYTIENVVGDFSHARAGVMSQDDFAGIIGTEILRRFRVIFDYPQQRMILEPNGVFSAPYEFDMSGLFITYEGAAGSKLFKVYHVIKDSPGAQADLRVGDIIEAIDQQPTSKFTLPQIREMFKEGEGREHGLSIRRNGKLLMIRLRLRRII